MRLSSVGAWCSLLGAFACAGEDFTPTSTGVGAVGGAAGMTDGASGAAVTAGSSSGATGGTGAASGAAGGDAAGSGGDPSMAGGGAGSAAGDAGAGGAAGGGASGANGGKAGSQGVGGTGGTGGGAAGAAAGSGGKGGTGGAGLGGSAAAGAAGKAGSGAGGLSGAGGTPGCVKILPCGDQVLQGGEGCDIGACEDAWCSLGCAQTPAAVAQSATEVCRNGICWMIVGTPRSTRGTAVQECAQLAAADGRAWKLGYWLNAAELATLMEVASYRLKGAPNDAMWLQPYYTQNKGWFLPNVVGAPSVDRPKPPNPDKDFGVRIVATTDGTKIVNTDPNNAVPLNQAWVLCRLN